MMQDMQTPMSSIILASQSPWRKQLLASLGVTFTTQPADVDESTRRGEKPLDYVKRIARAKAEKIKALNPKAIVIAADTPVIAGRRILQNPQSAEEAAHMLRVQSNRRVHIPTAIVVIAANGIIMEDMCQSWVKFKPLSAAEIAAHVAKESNWKGISGALQLENGRDERFLLTMHGSISSIMGLPLYHTTKLLRRAGVKGV